MSSLFRREVLDRLAAPEELDRLMTITTPKSWFALTGLCGLLILAVIWGIYWTSPTTVSSQGMLVPVGGVQTLAAQQPGTVSAINVHTGDIVNPGQTLATVTPEGQGAAPVDLTSQSPAQVLGVSAAPNQTVQAGAPLLVLATLDKPLQVATFLPSSQVSGARPGMSVRVAPASVDPTKFGYVKGKIESVGAFPATAQELKQTLGTDELVRSFTSSGPVVQVVVTLDPDSGTKSGFKWSSADGPPYPLTSGTFAKATVILSEDHPFRLHF
jgi:hypothetical protein